MQIIPGACFPHTIGNASDGRRSMNTYDTKQSIANAASVVFSYSCVIKRATTSWRMNLFSLDWKGDLFKMDALALLTRSS